MPSTAKFDYAAARRAGFTDEQIAASLAAKRAAGVDVYIDRSEADSARGIASDPTMMTAENNPLAQFMNSLGGRAAGLLPTAGGIAGGVLGGMAGGLPGAAIGSGLGGAAGEGIREAAEGDPLSPANIALEGAGQAAWQGIGGGLARGAAKLAPGFMQKALGGVVPLAKRFNTTSRGVSETVLGMKLPVTEAGERAATLAGQAARGARSAALAGAGGQVSAKGLAMKAIKTAEGNLGRPLTESERKFIVKMVRDEANSILTKGTFGAVPRSGSKYTLREAEQIKEAAAKNARPAYKADQAAASVSVDPALSKQIAKGARSKLSKVPGVDELNMKIKDSMVAQQAIHGALEKATGEFMPIRLGPFSAGIQLPREKLGDIALMLNSSKFQRYMRQSPRAAAEAIQQMLYADQDETAQP